jgi:hypothetical protein
MKTCTKCLIPKEPTEFYPTTGGRSRTLRLMAQCKECTKALTSARQKTEQGKVNARRAKLRHLYNISLEQYDEMLEAQGGCCKLCGIDTPAPRQNFSVDHDHTCCPGGTRSCGKCVRGLLCLRCNNALGWFETHKKAVTEYTL